MHRFHSVRFAAEFALALSVASCALPTPLPNSTTLSPPDGHVVIIGKIELDPPLLPEFEQKTHWNVINDGAILNRVLIATGDTARPIQTGDFGGDDWQNYINAYWGEHFAVVAPRTTRYLNGVAIPLDVAKQDFLWFPGGLAFRPPATGDVIYVGTLLYKRNDFNEILGIDVVNEKSEALAELQETFDVKPDNVQEALWLLQFPWEQSNKPAR